VTVRYRSGDVGVNVDQGNRRDAAAQPDDPRPLADDGPEEANAAGTFLAAALLLIHEGWNRLEDLGWVGEFGSESQRAILNLDHLDPFSIRALSARERRD
jgi:hypothetical protein